MKPPALGKTRRRPSGRPRLGYLLRQAAAAHRLGMERALSDIGVTPPQFLVLRMLAEAPESSSADIARAAALTTPTVSVIVANLKRLKALESRPHAVHGRIQRLNLTGTGEALLAACLDRTAKVEAELQVGITIADAEIIAAWLRVVEHGGR